MIRIKHAFVTLAVLAAAGCGGPFHLGGSSGTRPQGKAGFSTEEIHPETYLRKLSMHIRGRTPDLSEYAELGAAPDKAVFLKMKTGAYLASPEHADKMNSRLEELFSLAPTARSHASFRADKVTKREAYARDNSLNDLFLQISRENLSWDTLLTGKSYTAHPLVFNMFERGGQAFTTTDLEYFAAVAGTDRDSKKAAAVTFAADDARVAGSLTTSRFFNRYANTAINKNRRRAAAVFRIFLCDDMKAVVVDEKGNIDPILDRVFPESGNGGPKRPIGGDLHGSDQACMKCHYKLDPLGHAFQASGLVLSPFTSPGSLTFKRADGTLITRQGRGIADVAKAITEQPEYVRCQVEHFWRWFVGQDQFLEKATLDELSAKFEEVGRRPNDFIAHLVSRPEFAVSRMADANAQMIYQVKTTLQNCNGCHANYPSIPSFTEWPIGGSTAAHGTWLAKIRGALALDGGKRWMPPVTSVWQPDADQIALIKQWFEKGAPQ